MKAKTFKRVQKQVYLFLMILILPALLSSQDIINGFVRGQGKADLAITFTYETYDRFYRGKDLVDLPPMLRKYTVQTWSAYLAYGLTDSIDIVLNMPYTTASADADPLIPNPPSQEEKGFQDGALFIKWRAFHRPVKGSGEFSIVTAVGVSSPLSDYISHAPVSIGNHSTYTDARLNLMYKFDFGLFSELQGGYSIRSEEVPNAFMISGKVGYSFTRFYADIWLQYFSSTDGTDIGDQGFTFPSNHVYYLRMGATAFYSIIPQIGVTLAWATILDGRNIGKYDSWSAGLVYRFNSR